MYTIHSACVLCKNVNVSVDMCLSVYIVICIMLTILKRDLFRLPSSQITYTLTLTLTLIHAYISCHHPQKNTIKY